MNKNKKMKKTIKYALIILIIIAIIVVIALYKSNKKTIKPNTIAIEISKLIGLLTLVVVFHFLNHL